MEEKQQGAVGTVAKGTVAGGKLIFAMHCENFAKIAKISQSYRNFRYAQIFAKLAKFR